MTSPTETGKVCVVCGVDCAGKPRVKDAKGRYYCKACHEAATKRQAPNRVASPPARSKPTAPPVNHEPLSLLDQLVDQSPPAHATHQCPQCGGYLAEGAVLCTACGFNTQTGQRLNVTVKKAKKPSAAAGSVAALVRNPLAAAVLAVAAYGLVIAIGAGQPEEQSRALIFYVWHFPFSVVVGLWVLILAFRESIGTGFLTLCVPCYVLYFIFAVCDNMWARWLYLVSIVGTILMYVLFPEVMFSSADRSY